MSLKDILKEIDAMSKEELEKLAGRKFITNEGEFEITDENEPKEVDK